MPAVWRGESWDDRREEFRAAFIWAQRMATAIPGREADDLRLIEQCSTYGHCSDTYDFEARSLTPDRYPAVKQLAHAMKEALERRDPSPFLTGKP